MGFPAKSKILYLFKLPPNSKYQRALCAVDSATAWTYNIAEIIAAMFASFEFRIVCSETSNTHLRVW
jgi:hypothetical protein